MLASSPAMAFLATRDAPRAEAFHAGGLGLTRELGLQKVAGPVAQAFTAFGARALPRLWRHWRKMGVALERFGFQRQTEKGIWTAPGGARIAWFKDPDGSFLSLTEPGGHSRDGE